MNQLATAMLAASLLTQGQCVDNDEPTHEQWTEGDCASCHEDDPPSYHADGQWTVVHGRSEHARVDDCASCHETKECADCHARKPASHTPGFLQPAAHGPERQLHAALGRLRPSACGACHQSLALECTTCHAADEVWPWQTDANERLLRWAPMLQDTP